MTIIYRASDKIFFALSQNPRCTVDEMSDKPPSYDIVMGFDIPPPPYHTIVIEHDDYKVTSCSKIIAIQHI